MYKWQKVFFRSQFGCDDRNDITLITIFMCQTIYVRIFEEFVVFLDISYLISSSCDVVTCDLNIPGSFHLLQIVVESEVHFLKH